MRDAVLLAAAGSASDDLAAQLRVTVDQAAVALDSSTTEAALERWIKASQDAASAQ